MSPHVFGSVGSSEMHYFRPYFSSVAGRDNRSTSLQREMKLTGTI